MKALAPQLPAQFADLDVFVEEWGNLETPNERYLQRQTLPMDRLTAYYEAVTPRLASIFEHLDRFPFHAPLPVEEALLFRVVMAMSEVAQAIEIFNQPRIPNVPVGHNVAVSVMKRA